MSYATFSSNTALNFKIVVTGGKGVGKSSLLIRWLHDSFDTIMPTIPSEDLRERIFKRNDKTIKLRFSEAPGFASPTDSPRRPFRGADAVLVVYDVTDRQTYNTLDEWCTFAKNCTRSKVFLIGNKIDKENRIVDLDIMQDYASGRSMFVYETSAITFEGVEKALYSVMKELAGYAPDRVDPEDWRRSYRTRPGWFLSLVSCWPWCGRHFTESPPLFGDEPVGFRPINATPSSEEDNTSTAPSGLIHLPVPARPTVAAPPALSVPTQEEDSHSQKNISKEPTNSDVED